MKGTRLRGVLVGAVVLTVALASAALFAVSRADAQAAPVVIGGARPQTPDISGTRVVWADKRADSYDIFLFDGLTGVTTRLTNDSADQVDPTIDGNTVVWSDLRGGNADLWSYDIVTGIATQVTAYSTDQWASTLSGDWVAWRDSYNGGLSANILGYNRTTAQLANISYYSGPTRGAPRSGADLVVWEQRDAGRQDYDVWAYRYGNGGAFQIAATTKTEDNPATDGRYVVWSEGVGTAANIRAYDTSNGRTFDVCTDPGAQTSPRVADGVAYWIDDQAGRPLHIDSKPLAGGAQVPYVNYGTGDIAGYAVDGPNVAWLEKDRTRWRVRAVFNEGTGALDRFSQLIPIDAVWNAVRSTPIADDVDNDAPEVASTSVRPGETNVPKTRGLTVYFSEDLAPRSINARTVRLVDNRTGKPVRARLRYSALTRSVSIKPTRPLAPTSYTIVVDPTITDKAGNAMVDETRVSFATVRALADTTPPSEPPIRSARVSGLSSITITWRASVDDVGINQYVVKRYFKPIDAMNWGAATTVATVSSTTLSVTVARVSGGTTDEAFRRYTYYYAVGAFDAAPNASPISANVVPDPHGTVRTDASTRICQQCHYVHGAAPAGRTKLGANSAAACYECHGRTNAADPPNVSTYATNSSMDIQYEFGDDSTIASSGPNLVGRSIHRNASVADPGLATECSMCHAPHKQPANWNSNSYEASTSFPKLLKGDSTRVSRYMTATAFYDKRWCWSCHGANASTYLDDPDIAGSGGAQTYIDMGGDHETGFTDSSKAAHRENIVPASPRPSSDTSGPLVSCWACHGIHKTGARQLVDYRLSGATDQRYEGAGICYECHTSAVNGADETLSVGARPYTWNGRDVKAEFARKSHHPTAPPAYAPPPSAVDATWTQTTYDDFDLGTTRNQTVVTQTAPAGAIELEPILAAGASVAATYYPLGDLNTLWAVNTGNRWAAIDDPYNAPDDGTTYMTGDVANEVYQARSTTPNIPANATNISVKIRSRVGNGTFCNYWVVWRHAGTWYTEPIRTPAAAYTTYEDVLADPGGDGWSAAEANQITGLGLGTSNTAPNVTQLHLVVTYDLPGAMTGYVGSGTALTDLIPTTGGTLNLWRYLTINGAEPAGTTMTVDVLDSTGLITITTLQYTGSPTTLDLSANGVDSGLYPFIRLRANLQGDVVIPPTPTPREVHDLFTDSGSALAAYDATWTDLVLGTASDPDAAVDTYWASTDQTMTNTSAWTFTNPSTMRWGRTTGSGNPAPSLDTSNSTATRAYATATIDVDLTGRQGTGGGNFTYNFDYLQNVSSTTDIFRFSYSTDGGGTWTQVWQNATGIDRAAWTPSVAASITLPSQVVKFAFMGTTNAVGEYMRLDNFQIIGETPGTPTNAWPTEGGDHIKLRAAGTEFRGTADSGELFYVDSAVATWLAGSDWDMNAYVGNFTSANASAGLILRTGTSEANALAANARNASVHLSTRAEFVTRGTIGGGTTVVPNGVALATGPPKWLRLSKRDNTMTAYYSNDSSLSANPAWTKLGNDLAFTPDANIVVGLALSSGAGGTSWADADFGHFDLVEVPEAPVIPPASKTPRLDDWTISYRYFPAPAPSSAGIVTCVSCHNTHLVTTGTANSWAMSRTVDPSNTKVFVASSASTATDFCIKCHDGTPPQATQQASTYVPYSVAFSVMSTSTYPFFPGWDKSLYKSSGHYRSGITRMTIGCENCHDPHGSDNPRLLALTEYNPGGSPNHVERRNTTTVSEERLCWGCHLSARTPNCAGGACHPNIDTNANVRMNLQSAFSQRYSHPTTTAATANKHTDTETASQLGTGTPSFRHAECPDCHNPHAARPGMHATGTANPGNVLLGATGVQPSWPTSLGGTVSGVPTSFAAVSIDETTSGSHYEAQVCFKCHSDYAASNPAQWTVRSTSGSTYTYTDQAMEFNPNNQSGHNVVAGAVFPKTTTAQGLPFAFNLEDTDLNLAGSGFNVTSHLTCTDCHTNDNAAQARGPHGSGSLGMTRPYAANQTTHWYETTLDGWNSSNFICRRCHTSMTSNQAHNESDHNGIGCDHCHVRIPHGWKRPRLLRRTTGGVINGIPADGLPYADPGQAESLTGFAYQAYTNGFDNEDSQCQDNCEHSAGAPYWP